MVRIDKEYVFDTDDGPKMPVFDGRSQLLVFHLMFGPEDTEGCPGCSFMADHVDAAVPHLEAHDVTFLAASRGPLERLVAYERCMGWSRRWVSSYGSDFNVDFAVFTDEERHVLGSSAGVANRSRHKRVGKGMTRLTTYAFAIAVFAILLLTVAGCGKGGGY